VKRSLLLLLLTLSPAASCLASGCETSPAELEKILALDYKTFDLTDDKGAREYTAKACYLQAAQLTDLWQLRHQGSLEFWQTTNLYFHAGQRYAEAGRDHYGVAVERLRKSLVPVEAEDSPVTWNAYVQATIGFLKDDLEELQTRRRVMLTKKTRDNQWNIDAADAMIKCFGRPYLEAYSGPACRGN
jgi:hypothetical protein